MQRFWELILGLEKGFLSREGDFTLQFNPQWPGKPWIDAGALNWVLGVMALVAIFVLLRLAARSQLRPFRALLYAASLFAGGFFLMLLSGTAAWNLTLAALALGVIVYAYSREGRSTPVRVALGLVRAALFAFVIALLNRPVLTLGQSHTEPSVLAVMIDKSTSMRIRDGAPGPDGQAQTRLGAAIDLLTGSDRALLNQLTRVHTVRFYRFDQDAQPLATVPQDNPNEGKAPKANPTSQPAAVDELHNLQPTGQHTQVVSSVRDVLEDLQGQRVAGVVLLTDGRDAPQQPITDALNAVKNFGVKVYPIAVGSDRAPANIEVQTLNVQESAFKGDIINAKVTVRGTGYEPGHAVHLVLKDKKTNMPVTRADGSPAEQTASLPDDKPLEVEMQFKPAAVGTLDLVAEAVRQPAETDEDDNVRTAQVQVLDARIAVLYIDGYPRWDYRYIKNEMIRDPTVDISCWLTSAVGTNFAQEGDKPIQRLPESIQEIMDYDVVLIGDVDPRQFTDQQLQLFAEFVSKKGGGFGMVAGPRWSPQAYRNTAIEPMLPVMISRVENEEPAATSITSGFRPVLTKAGAESSIFRFLADKEANERYLQNDLQPLFWYCRGVVPKAIGEVYAEHPNDVIDGRKAPILVFGRYGMGRTMFSAIDDSWRWRFYTGEGVFDTYWVQTLRYLARSKKLGQRRATFTSERPTYELGEQVTVRLRVLDPAILQQLPEQLRVEIQDAAGQVIRQESLVRQEGQPELYVGTWTAERSGRFTVHLPSVAAGIEAMDLPLEVIVPRLELAQPQVDRTLLTRLASETLGQTVDYAQARTSLAPLIPSAAKIIPVETAQPLWDAPLAMILFVLLISAEWVLRKVYGML